MSRNHSVDIVPGPDELHKAADDYFGRGLPITLCPAGMKKPLGIDWSDRECGKAWEQKHWTADEVARAFQVRGALNVGVRCGTDSGIIDIEADSPEQERAFAELFEGCEIPVTPTFVSKRGKHRLFAWHPDLERIGKSYAEYKGLAIRIGANGKATQSLLPPSTTDEVVRRWLVSLDDCDPATLPATVIQRIIASGSHLSSASTDTQAIACVSMSLCKDPSEAVAAAIAATIPSGPGHRYRRLFHFARLLKAIPSLADADVQSLKPIVRQWHQQALPTIRTKQFEETWIDFCIAWQNIRFPAGQEPIRLIYDEALSTPPPTIAERYETMEIRRLVALCRELQQRAGTKPFYLTCRMAGELLGISHVLANKWIRLLTLEGVLRVVSVGKRGRASEYLYLGDESA